MVTLEKFDFTTYRLNDFAILHFGPEERRILKNLDVDAKSVHEMFKLGYNDSQLGLPLSSAITGELSYFWELGWHNRKWHEKDMKSDR